MNAKDVFDVIKMMADELERGYMQTRCELAHEGIGPEKAAYLEGRASVLDDYAARMRSVVKYVDKYYVTED